MLSAREKVIEDFGLFFENYGLARSVGRIYGHLLTTPEPLSSLESIAESLLLSKASASTTVRVLITMQLIEKASLPGDRRDYYRVGADAHLNYLEMGMQKMLTLKTLTHQAAQLEDLTPEAHARLTPIDEMYQSMSLWMDRFFTEYREKKRSNKAEKQEGR